ncbi:hypothetical protein ACJIZ3_004839 [Penstemon smallii]|uniref:Homeobox-leucine zipper protein n=1 Tax=Penstemon smallii TaxID=265156 RepID=A0ABD3S354_9LAMI
MKRLNSSDSLGALMSICPNSSDEHNNPIYTRDFQTVFEGLDEEGCIEESGHVSEKKRRLSICQVKALEKNFEVENKLEPERKVKLAQELGLQPRQVAVWFQNRRARWKTKNLERDYGILKANFDGLKHNFESLQRDNEALLKEIKELKSKLNEDDTTTVETNVSVKEEPLVSETEEKNKLETQELNSTIANELNFENLNEENNNGLVNGIASDDSDSSAILNNEENQSPTAAISSSHGNGIILENSPHQFMDIHNGSMNLNFQFSHSKTSANALGDGLIKDYQPQFVKIEEHNFFGEESCSTLFSDDQAPTLHWYCSDEWN